MPQFGWSRLAYLIFVLSVLVIIARPGPDAEPNTLAAQTPGDAGTQGEPRESAFVNRWTEDEVAALEDLQGLGKLSRSAPNVAREPRVPVAQGSGERAAETERPKPPPEGPSDSEPPVFYRPSGVATRTGSGPACGDLGRLSESSRIVFPLERRFFYSYEDTWGAARPQGGHEGTDLMTPAGAPEYAVTDGTVVPVAGSNPNGWNSLGGYAVMVRADYTIGPVKKGDLFYYAHLDRKSPLKIGTRVRAGQLVGHAGDTGQGPEVTRGLFPPHLHLGWYDGTGGRSDVDSGAMNPYPLLQWVKSNGGAVTGGSDARFCEALGPPPASAGWPDQGDPGISPDLDTGSDDPTPSPIVRKDAGAQAAKPARPNRPDRPPKKDKNENRPEVHESQNSPRPNDETPGSGRPPSDQDRPHPQAPGSSPSGSQYDPSTGDSSSVQRGISPRKVDRPKPTGPQDKTAETLDRSRFQKNPQASTPNEKLES